MEENIDLYYCLMRYTAQKVFIEDKVYLYSIPAGKKYILDRAITDSVLAEYKIIWDAVSEGAKPVYMPEVIVERVTELGGLITNY